MSKIHRFKGFSVVDGDMKIKLNMDRFSRQYQEAQYLLDGMVMDSMVPFMPMITGDFINRTRVKSTSLQGSGKVCAAAAPYALMRDLERRKFSSASSLVGQPQRKILNTPNRHIHERKLNGSMPLNDNTELHGYVK